MTAKRVLCVDDYAGTCEMLGLLLRQAGYQVECASCVRDAWRLVQIQKFDCYILDYVLGDDFGTTLCIKIRAVDKRNPIIMLSGVVDEAAQIEARDAGADELLEKPICIPQLTGIVEGWLEMPRAPKPSRQPTAACVTSQLER